jgi:damage-control phosphatase, subfamily I
MKLYLDCVQCMFRQVLQAARFCGADEQTQERLLRETMRLLQERDWDCSPMELAQPVIEMVRRETGVDDPYLEVKKLGNREAQAHVAHVLEKIASAADPVNIALKAAIGGNIIDYGAQASFDLDATMDRVFRMDFAINDEAALVAALRQANSIAYLGDNAGEIVFDKILLETIDRLYGGKQITFVVRDQPLLNDALLADARAVGLDTVPGVEMVAMPPRIPGPDDGHRALWERIAACDVIISKGQGNYEGFSSIPGIFFLLMAKCDLIASDINARTDGDLKIGDMILWQCR